MRELIILVIIIYVNKLQIFIDFHLRCFKHFTYFIITSDNLMMLLTIIIISVFIC